MKYGYNDDIDRLIVKKFFKKTENRDLIDTPDKIYESTGQTADVGKLCIDLIDENDNSFCVEIEKLQIKRYEDWKIKGDAYVVEKKYWKYFDAYKNSVMIYLIFDDRYKFQNKIVRIDGSDIKTNARRREAIFLDTPNRSDGFLELYPVSLSFAKELTANISLTYSQPWGVNDKTLKDWKDKVDIGKRRYSIDSIYSSHYDVIRFKEYNDDCWFTGNYIDMTLDAVKKASYLNYKNFRVINRDDVIKHGRLIEMK